MKRCNAIWLNVFLYGLPLVLVAAIFAHWHATSGFGTDQGMLGFVNNIAGLVFALWMFMALYLSIRLMISEAFRDQVLSKLTFVRERDER